MTSPVFNCWKCGASLAAVLLPFSRLAKCRACKVDLHVCRMCRFYDKTVSNSCREPIAEKVMEKTRANFCGYFEPRDYAGKPDNEPAKTSQATLETLFGLEHDGANSAANDADQSQQALDALFGLGDKKHREE